MAHSDFNPDRYLNVEGYREPREDTSVLYTLRVNKHKGQYRTFDEDTFTPEGKPWSWNTESPENRAVILMLDLYFGRKPFTMSQAARSAGLHFKDWEHLAERFYGPFNYLTGIGIIQNMDHLKDERGSRSSRRSSDIPEGVREQWRDR